jgi:ankyrin repeat protein
MDVDSDTRHFLEQIKVNAISALVQKHRPIASVMDSFGRTPLHLACMEANNCGETAFDVILEASTKAAANQDMEGRTPLHYLVSRNDEIPLGFLEKVIAACPAALAMKDLVKETPVDLVESRRSEIRNVDAVLQLLKQIDTPVLKNDSCVAP